MPQVVDEVAKIQPGAVWASFQLSDNSGDFRDVTFKELAHCVNHTAWWMEGLIGRSNTFETIAYMGVSDIRYGFMLMAAIKLGYKVSFVRLDNTLTSRSQATSRSCLIQSVTQIQEICPC